MTRPLMRVLQIGKYYAPFKGGMETHLQTLCGELRHDVDVRVIVANPSKQSAHGTVDGIPVSRVGTALNFGSAPICPGMIRQIREVKADLVHIHLPNPFAVMAYLASGHKGPVVVGYHSDVVRQKKMGRLFEPILNRLMRRASAVIASSPNYIDSSPVLSAHRDRCRTIPYGLPHEEFDNVNPADVAALKARYGPRLVLGVGRLVYYKGFEHLVAAMRDVPGQLVLIGEGPCRPRLEKMIAAFGLQDRVHLLGMIENLVPYYHAANVFVLPSIARSESFGLVQLEAMACGTPVINTALNSSVPYVSLHDVSGLTVPPADAASLSRAIALVLDNPELAARYGQAARRRMHTEFGLDLMVRRTLDLYEEVMGRAAGEQPARRKGSRMGHGVTASGVSRER